MSCFTILCYMHIIVTKTFDFKYLFQIGWHLDDIFVEMPNGKRTIFPCNAWLAKDEGDGKLERDLFPLEELRNKSNKQHLIIGSNVIIFFLIKK